MSGQELARALLVILTPLLLGLLLLWRRARPVQRLLVLGLAAGGLVAGALAVHLLVFGALVSVHRDTVSGALLHAVPGSALPEETLKVLLLLLLLWREGRRQMQQVAVHPDARVGAPLHGVLAGLAVGLGFATVENAFYAVMSEGAVDMVRLFTAMPCHAFLGAIAGHYIAFGLASGRRSLLVKAWLVPVFVHGLYNLPLVLDLPPQPWANQTDELALSAMVLAWLAAWTRLLLLKLRPQPA